MHPPVPMKPTHFGFAHEPDAGGGAGAGAEVEVVVGVGAGAGAGAVSAFPSAFDPGGSSVVGAPRRSEDVVSLDVLPVVLLLRRPVPSVPEEQAAVRSAVATSNKTRTFPNQQPVCRLLSQRNPR